MKKQDDDFLKRLLSTFKIEAAEHIKALSSGLIDLEKVAAENQVQIVEAVFREAHSLKGAARAVNNADIEAICQSMEGVFSALKCREVTLSSGMLDVLHRALRCLERLLSFVESELPVVEKSETASLIRQLEGLLREGRRVGEQGQSSQSFAPDSQATLGARLRKEAPRVSETPASAGETVRIAVSKLDSIRLQAEEMLSAKLAVGQRRTDLQNFSSTAASWKKEWRKIHSDVQTLQRLLERNTKLSMPEHEKFRMTRVLEFLHWNHAFIKSLEYEVAAVSRSAAHDQRSISGMVDNLLDDTTKALMLPFSSLLEILPRFVRDLSRDQGKDVELVLRGAEIEVDRRILEEMKDPLIHLVRNCVDHGVEKPKERERKKKPPSGAITVAVSQKDGDKVEIVVADDGRGIDAAKVRSAALKLGVISVDEGQRLSDQDALRLIFHSGVSTSAMITDISGRGLGLAIVREKVEHLGGTVAFDTHVDVGTTFRIVLPLTLATFRGLLVRSGDHLFVVPTLNVERALIVKKDEIKSVENMETIQLRGRAISLVRLNDVLQLPPQHPSRESAKNVRVVVLVSAEKRIAFLVDEVLHEQQVLVKSLGPQLTRVRNVASATVLGTGKVVPILNVPDLMKSAIRIARAGVKPEIVAAKKGEEKRKSVLVVEDSITARTLLKNILEAAGYEVKSAIDGIDAFTQLRTGEFDVVVSDVDMPRMNGFDLTAKIRADKKLAELPVVLVTALESREDRERGVEIGASAYIVKSSFDQSNLLEVIRRLI
jgi:two-component system chemotaxis sensor kinase CheA